MTVAAIIPAAGIGSRMKLDHPKQYHEIHGTPILAHTVQPFLDHQDITAIVVVVPAEWLEETAKLLENAGIDTSLLTLTEGGKRRQDSVYNGLRTLDKTTDIVLVHDGARPCVTASVINHCITAIQTHGAAIAAVPVKDTLKKGDGKNLIVDTVDRENMWQAQTPQGAKYSLLCRAFENARDQDVTDEAMLLELAGFPVALVESEETNIKVTRPEDLDLAEKIMRSSDTAPFRIGHGFDAHRLVEGRKLVLGGVTVPHHLGLAGHSDADVVTHALCDSLLGSLGKGDIGSHFPDSDKSYKDIYSITLLEKVIDYVKKAGYRVGNIDLTIICQDPKLAPYLDSMKNIFASACDTNRNNINIKATTTENMGYAGRGEGISCHSVVLLFTDH
jgi:2-C-methyl-D-erythritol 4-phosphate cytidylyltransferase / 2-C-methyl-D-erythritol 2,4-cyclodiphosphate synthase